MALLTETLPVPGMARNLRFYPWFKLLQNITFWQAIWFLFFQGKLSAAEAILLYAVYDVATTVLEVPSGYASDRLGRKKTLLVSTLAPVLAMACFVLGDSFVVFALGQVLLGAGAAFASGTDSAFLFETLEAEHRPEDIEAEELRAWRFSFSGLAVSAAIGGAVALWSYEATFVMSGITMFLAFLIALLFTEPPRGKGAVTESKRLRALGDAFRQPVLVWLFVLSLLMYGFSHLPFVFGQPFIQEALAEIGFKSEAPLVSGVVTMIMMVVSLGTSLIAPGLRKRFGLGALLLAAFGLQILLAGVLAATSAVAAIAILFLRMVPDSLSKPFIIARIQPLLKDESRATFLSLKSLAGRLVFAASLWGASFQAASVGEMTHGQIQQVLLWYVVAGVIFLASLAIAARSIAVDDA